MARRACCATGRHVHPEESHDRNGKDMRPRRGRRSTSGVLPGALWERMLLTRETSLTQRRDQSPVQVSHPRRAGDHRAQPAPTANFAVAYIGFG
jgi:hypothetical protein